MRKIIYLIALIAVALGSYLAGQLRHPLSNKNPIVNQGALEKKHSTFESTEDIGSQPAGTISISPERQQVVGIKISRVERKPLVHTLRLLGTVAVDETRLFYINATVEGWITKTLPNTSGSFVRKNEVLGGFYSPEFLSAAQAFLFALNAKERAPKPTGEETTAQQSQIAQFDINLRQYKDSLKNLGMGELQIEEMIKRRKYMENVDIVSPTDGFILVRNISEGLRFEKGRELYRIADLSKVWILANVFEYEAQFFKPGLKAKVLLPYQKKNYWATVSRVLPIFDGTSRTLKVRLETDNPGFTLRPDMFVDLEFPVSLPPCISVPVNAVLDSGLKKIVFVVKGNGYFQPREVETGLRLGKVVEITKGLDPGEKIATSGNFLIDSESRMELAAEGMTGTLSQDPVCGLPVSMAKAEKKGMKSIYLGKTYYFLSEENKRRFETNPKKFLEEK